MIVRVQYVLGELGVAGDVDLGHAFGGNTVEIFEWIKIVISRRHVDVVYVQKYPAIGALHHLIQKLPFGHLGDVEFSVAAYVFDSDWNFEIVASLTDLARSNLGRFKSVRHGKQIVAVCPIHASPTEMIRKPRGFGAFDERL